LLNEQNSAQKSSLQLGPELPKNLPFTALSIGVKLSLGVGLSAEI
jgi:hypothetical protein